MSRNTLFLALVLSVPAGSALAQGTSPTGISWSYFDIGIQHINPDESSLDSSAGPLVRGSGMINENWHLFLGWNRAKLKGERSYTTADDLPGVVSANDDVDRFHVGIGYNMPIGASTDLFSRVAWERVGSADFRARVGTQTLDAKLEKTDGYSIEVGLRSAFAANFEGGASVRYTKLDEPQVRLGGQTIATGGLVGDSTTSLVLQGQYKFGNGWGIVGEGDLNSDYQAVFFGARLSY